MAQLLVRNVAQDTVDALREMAARNGLSVEAQHRALLTEAVSQKRESGFAEAAALRRLTRGRSKVPSWVLIREDRDRR